MIDSFDYGCFSAYDTNEVLICGDGIDNDSDGWTDYADPDCDNDDYELGFGNTMQQWY